MGIQSKILTQGDNLLSLASAYLGDSSLWQEIAILNDLDYPFIVPIDYEPFGTEKVLKVGQTIHLPVQVNPNSIIEADKYGDSGLGLDLRVLPKTGSIYSTNMDEGQLQAVNGDLGLSVGIECLRQDLLHRLLTPKGSIPWHPNYGSEISSLIGNKMTPENVELIQVSVQECIYEDDRIEDISDISVYAYDTAVWLEARARVTSGDVLELKEQIGGM